MTKKEIIDAIAFVDVPPNSKLVEHEIGNQTASVHTGANIGGSTRLFLAKQIVEELIAETVEFPDTPNGDLLQRIYEAFLNYNQNMLLNTIIEGVDDEIKTVHCQMVLRLRDISQSHKIPFVEPEDTILS